MYIEKIGWFIRGLLLSNQFKKMGCPSYIGKPIYIHKKKNIIIGNKVRVYPGCRMETIGNGQIEIQDNVSIAQNFHISSAIGSLIIGKNSTILGNVFITNIDHNYKEIAVHILEQPILYNETYIGENCFIGYGAAIQAGTILGKQCIIGANSVVRGKFEDYSVIVGVPARVVKRYNLLTAKWEKV